MIEEMFMRFAGRLSKQALGDPQSNSAFLTSSSVSGHLIIGPLLVEIVEVSEGLDIGAGVDGLLMLFYA
jgi:hypothetical protein